MMLLTPSKTTSVQLYRELYQSSSHSMFAVVTLRDSPAIIVCKARK